MKNEALKDFLVNSDDTGRFIVKSLKTGHTYYVEPLDGGERIDWGDLNPATKKLEGDYGSKHKGAIKESESLITEENGFTNITTLPPGYSPLEYIEELDKNTMKTMNKIPFDPKYIGQPEIEFETRCGYKAMFVRVSRFDKSKYIFEIDCPDRDRNVVSIAYDPDGINPGGNKDYDLFVVLPEPKLTKFQSTVLEVFENIITDYNLDISQTQESRLGYVEKIRDAFIEELGIRREEIMALENILDYVPEGDNLEIVEGLLQKLKEYETI